jgi:hypothetical protein
MKFCINKTTGAVFFKSETVETRVSHEVREQKDLMDPGRTPGQKHVDQAETVKPSLPQKPAKGKKPQKADKPEKPVKPDKVEKPKKPVKPGVKD